jgi:hypothetical protein
MPYPPSDRGISDPLGIVVNVDDEFADHHAFRKSDRSGVASGRTSVMAPCASRRCTSPTSRIAAQTPSGGSSIIRVDMGRFFSYFIKENFTLGDHQKKLTQFWARIFITVGAVLKLFFLAAFPYFADMTMDEKPFFSEGTSITINVLRFELCLILFGPLFGDFLPLVVIILAGSQVPRAFGAIDPANSNHFLHVPLLLTLV